MKIISIDDEELQVAYMKRMIWQIEPEAEFVGFTETEKAFQYLSENKVNVAFLDIEMSECSGIEFAGRCKQYYPELNIIFVTGYSKYVMDAFKMHASGYLMKPVRAADLRMELDNLRHPLMNSSDHRIRIQTFGNFAVFLDERPLKLPLSKCLECLAYLVDRRGALISVAELAAVLWEEEPFDHAMRNRVHQIVFTLIKALKENRAEDIIVKQNRKIGIIPSKVDCDYYRAMSGDISQFNFFAGEYMKNYSWAEFSIGELIERKNKK